MSTMEKNRELEDLSKLCCLPTEILNRIFAVLPLQDRKSVRLTCRSWYQFSTCLSITKNEKLVFRADFDIEDVAKVMQESNFSNFEFQGLPINRLPANIWEKCGRRIRSLEFFECFLINGSTIKNIIIHCENLISFTFRTRVSPLGRKIFSSPGLLDKLVEKGIQRAKLRTFALLIDDPEAKVVIRKLFLVFPCITHFAIKTMSPEWFSYFPVSLESLTFERTSDTEHWMEMCISKSKQGLRLRHLDGLFDETGEFYMRDEILFNFFSSQRSLNAIKLYFPRCSSRHQAIKKITFHILECCPNLQEFCIRFDNEQGVLDLKREEFSQFLALISKLKCLSLDFIVSGSSNKFWRRNIKSLPFPKNFVLTTLELRSPIMNRKVRNDLHAALLRHCPLLLHLKLDSVTDFTLQIIFKNLLKLQTLSLQDSRYCTQYGFTGHGASREGGYSIKRLQQLKYLSIEEGFHKLRGIEEIILEFQFPLLESLQLEIDFKMVPKEIFVRLSSQIPNLRQLHILCHKERDCWTTEMIEFCKYLKNLEYLFMIADVDCPYGTEKHFIYQWLESGPGFLEINDFVIQQTEEFAMCPSLRYISDYNHCTFSIDPLTKKIENRDADKFKFKRYDDVFRVPK